MKKIICILSMLSILLVSCNKVDSSYISSIDVTIDFLRLDFNGVEKSDVNYLQIIGDELYYSVDTPLDKRIDRQYFRTVSLNKINIKTNEITVLRTFDEDKRELLGSYFKKGETSYYRIMTVSNNFENQKPFEYKIYIESAGNLHCIDTIYQYTYDYTPNFSVVNDEVFYMSNDLKIEDEDFGTYQLGFKLMNIVNDKAIEIFSFYAPMVDFTFDNDLYERFNHVAHSRSGKYLAFMTELKSESYIYVYDTETKEMERIKLGQNVLSVGILNNELLLAVMSEDTSSSSSVIQNYELLNIDTKERRECGNFIFLRGYSLSEEILIAYQDIEPLSAVYIDKEGQIQLVSIKDDKTGVVSSGGILPISETSFLLENSYFDQIVELEIK